MQKDKIIEMAARGIVPEEEMTCPERALFYTMKDIYEQFRLGKLSKETGESLKNKTLRQFEIDKGAIESAMRILRENSELWKRVEIAANNYRLERTLEHADAFIEAVYNVRIKPKEGEDQPDG